jgi:hypothetical protein
VKDTPGNGGEYNTVCKCEHFSGSQGKRVGCLDDFAPGRAIKMKTFPMTQRKPLPVLFMRHHWPKTRGFDFLSQKG